MKENSSHFKTIRILFVSIFVSFFSCYSSTEKSEIKIADVAAYNVGTFPKIFETAFFKNRIDSDVAFTAVEIGRIKIESGKIIACDPIVMNHGMPFTQMFPIGEFPVQLALMQENKDARVAFSRIIFSNDSVSKWECALTNGQSPTSITGMNIYCYGVDGGIGMFIDELADKDFVKKGNAEWYEAFVKNFQNNYRNSWSYVFPKFDGHNLAAFSTGYGDGCYATYIGFNSKNEPCRLLTDFGIIEWWKEKE
ncbi:MAG: DUF4241 domain-containing protein [Bacteroidia bacterium]